MYGYHFQAWTQLRYQRFENCLEVEPRVGTLIGRYLVENEMVNVNTRDKKSGSGWGLGVGLTRVLCRGVVRQVKRSIIFR